MLRRIVPVFALCALLPLAAIPQQAVPDQPKVPQPEPPPAARFTVQANEVILPVTVTDDKGRFVSNLEAKTQKKKDDTLYIVDGANSPAKTPLAAPILLFENGKINPENLQLFQMESKDGHREFVVQKNTEPIPSLPSK